MSYKSDFVKKKDKSPNSGNLFPRDTYQLLSDTVSEGESGSDDNFMSRTRVRISKQL